MTKHTPINDAFRMVEGFGSAEQCISWAGWESSFYSHEYTQEGFADVLAAATDYINRTMPEGDAKKIALHTVQEYIHTDLYRRQTDERWYVNVQACIDQAKGIAKVLK